MQYNMKQCRKKAGYSQLQVAVIMNTQQHQISKWERGEQDITLSKAIRLAELYNVTLDELAGRTLTQNTK